MVVGSQRGSQGDGEADHRFSHLLQPIRDLTKNWDVDIAAQLEGYLEELENISVTFDGGSKTMNFADAALLIQGSTCVYSKKVEYLYSLVYQVLDLLASKKKLLSTPSVDQEGNDADVATLNRDRDPDDEFLSLDDIKEVKTLDKKIDDDVTVSAVLILPKTPLSLVALDEGDKEENPLLSIKGEVLGSRMDFKMNQCTVHLSGFLLLDISHLPMLEALSHGDLADVTPQQQNSKDNLLSVPSASENSESNTLVADDQQNNTVIDMGAPVAMDDDDDHHDDGPPPPADSPDESRRQLRDRRKMLFAAPPIPKVDVWEPLDPHQNAKSTDKPYRKKKTFRIPANLKTEASKKRKHQKDVPEKHESLVSIAEFCSKAYHSNASKFPSNSLKAPTLLEFEDLYWKEFKRRQQKLAQEKKLLAKQAQLAELAEDPADDNADNFPAGGTDDDDADDNDGLGFQVPEIEEGAGQANFGLDNLQNDDQAPEEQSDPVSSAPVVTSFEDLVRHHVEGYMAAAQQHAQLTDLAKRVTEWENHLLPRLAEQETRETFDIHRYGSRVIKKIAPAEEEATDNNHHDKEPQTIVMPFQKVVEGLPAYQVCRMFLATLQLANNYNVEILSPEESTDAKLNTMKLKLLSTRRHFEELEEYRAPSFV